jgi:hypothetical protein
MTQIRTIGWAAVASAILAGSAVEAQGIAGIIPTPENPPTRQGTRGANFLHLPVGARGAAMAGAVGSSVAGPTSWFWNPAGSARFESFSVAAGRQEVYSDLGLTQHYAAASLPLLGGTFGLAFNSLNSGSIERTTEASPFGDVVLGRTYEWTSTAASLGYARRLTDRLTVGGQFKLVNEGIPDANTQWFAADVGTQFETGIYGLVIGGALLHMGGAARAEGALISTIISTNEVSPQDTRVNLFTRDTELPTSFLFSAGTNLLGDAESLFGPGGGRHSIVTELALTDGVDLPAQVAFGAEYSFSRVIFARVGKKFYNDDRSPDSDFQYGLSGGFGVRIPVMQRDIRFDYSYTSLGDLQNIQILSFEFGR